VALPEKTAAAFQIEQSDPLFFSPNFEPSRLQHVRNTDEISHHFGRPLNEAGGGRSHENVGGQKRDEYYGSEEVHMPEPPAHELQIDLPQQSEEVHPQSPGDGGTQTRQEFSELCGYERQIQGTGFDLSVCLCLSSLLVDVCGFAE